MSAHPGIAADRLSGKAQSLLSIRSLWTAVFIVTLTLSVVFAWVERFEMGSDGVAYLDLGDSWWRGDWRNAVNGLWSPLYSVIVGGILALVKPSAYWEYPVVHLVNFGLSIVALMAFSFFLRSLLAHREALTESVWDASERLPDWAIVLIGSTLYAVSSFVLIGVSPTTPDVLMATTFFVAMALVVKIQTDPKSGSLHALLGIVLGVGYLAKAPMLPIGIVILTLLLVQAITGCKAERRLKAKRVLLATALFVAVSTPYVLALSAVKGSFTTGQSGALNYAWHVNGIPRFHWRGKPEGSGVALHPTRLLNENPPVYEFGGAVKGTYPIWYDAAYWNSGLVPHFDLKGQLKVIRSAISTYRFTFVNVLGSFWIAFVPLVVLGRRNFLPAMRRASVILLPTAAPFAMYALVHAETRYLGAFAVVLCLVSIAYLKVPRQHAKLASLLVVLASGVLLASAATYTFGVVQSSIQTGDSNSHWLVSSALSQSDIRKGDKVAFLRPTAASGNHAWARLSGVQIVSEMEAADVPALWAATEERRDNIYTLLKEAGVRGVVAANVPNEVSNGWKPLGDTGLYLRTLN